MPNNQEEKNKKEVLDLLGGTSKKKRDAKQDTTKSATPASEPAAPAKKEALDLLSGSKKKAPVDVIPEPAPVVVEEPAPVKEEAPQAEPEATEESKIINLKPPVSVSELATLIKAKPFQVIKDLMGMGIFANPNTPLDADAIGTVCEKHGYTFAREKREKGKGVKVNNEPIKEPEPEPIQDVVETPTPQAEEKKADEPKAQATNSKKVKKKEKPVKESSVQVRTPIITVMGHVDHGKTSLLDYIRNTRVAKGEAGGITQHIGAYTVDYNGSTLTFLDTPGHAIFTEMRARGADVTDIVVLVVAANDGIMPQTREAIAHSKAAGKTIIVAVNKCDLPAADPMRTRAQLMEEGLIPTDLGGDVECVDVSALTGDGIDDLLGLLVLQAEVMELKADPKTNCRAAIVEARVEAGSGSSATAIVKSGTITVGMPFICGPYSGKVKALINDRGERIKSAGPGMPVEITGFSETPNVGDELVEMKSDRDARKLSEERQEELRKQRLAQPKKTRMEELLAMMGDGTQKAQLKILLKGDVQGSVEAIKKAILDIKSEKVECVFLTAAAGPISETDVLLASTSDAVILGFNVKVEANAVRLLKREGVQVKLYSIVYELIDQVRDAMLGLLEPETRETIIGHAKVLQVFKLNKGRAAGCMVSDGRILRKCEARVIRDGTPVFDGKMSTLRRFQDEVEEVKSGLECGIRLGDFNEYEENDIIECYTLEKIQQTL